MSSISLLDWQRFSPVSRVSNTHSPKPPLTCVRSSSVSDHLATPALSSPHNRLTKTGFYYFTSAVSAALGQAFTGLSDDPLLVWLYGSVAIIAFCGGCGFWFFFRSYDKIENELNMLPESAYIGHKDKLGDEKVDGSEHA
jgi:hypothetical protein